MAGGPGKNYNIAGASAKNIRGVRKNINGRLSEKNKLLQGGRRKIQIWQGSANFPFHPPQQELLIKWNSS